MESRLTHPVLAWRLRTCRFFSRCCLTLTDILNYGLPDEAQETECGFGLGLGVDRRTVLLRIRTTRTPRSRSKLGSDSGIPSVQTDIQHYVSSVVANCTGNV